MCGRKWVQPDGLVNCGRPRPPQLVTKECYLAVGLVPLMLLANDLGFRRKNSIALQVTPARTVKRTQLRLDRGQMVGSGGERPAGKAGKAGKAVVSSPRLDFHDRQDHSPPLGRRGGGGGGSAWRRGGAPEGAVTVAG